MYLHEFTKGSTSITKVVESVISEVLKIRIPGRHCNGIDMVGNIICVGIGVVIGLMI